MVALHDDDTARYRPHSRHTYITYNTDTLPQSPCAVPQSTWTRRPGVDGTRTGCGPRSHGRAGLSRQRRRCGREPCHPPAPPPPVGTGTSGGSAVAPEEEISVPL